MKKRSYYVSIDPWGNESVTANEFPASDDERLDTGILDAEGRPIKRKPTRVPLGFHIAR